MSNESAVNERAESLASQAKACVERRELQKAYQLAKEALSLAPQNSNVQSVIAKLQQSDSNSQILPLCRSYLWSKKVEDGETASQYLKKKEHIPFGDVEELATLFFDQAGATRRASVPETSPLLDELSAALLANNHAIRVEFATRFSKKYAVGDPTRLFRLFYARGEKSFNALEQTIIDESIWSSTEQYKAAKRDAFLLSLSKLLEPAVEHAEWVMLFVTRLLSTHAEDLRQQPQLRWPTLLTSDNFEIVLMWLDIRAPVTVRAQATLATTRFLEEMKEDGKGEETVHNFIRDQVAKTHNDDLIIAFSAATTCFPLCPQTVTKLFLTPGFLEGLVPTLQKNAYGHGSGGKSHKLEKASLDLMSAACIDKACREAIRKQCSDWLDDIANTHEEEEYASLAALILSKIGQQEVTAESSGVVANYEGLPSMLMNMTVNSTSNAAKASSIEGLAYTSLKGKVKEEIIANTRVLDELVKVLKTGSPSDPAVFGILTIFANVTAYRPVLTEEQKKMSQLKSYANSSKPTPDDPLDDDAQVTIRCKKVIDAGLVPAIASQPVKTMSAIGLNQFAMILNSLAREQKSRGILAQQGAVKMLSQILDRLQGTGAAHEGPYRVASHALARILISVNPAHVFSAVLPAASAIRPLNALLKQDVDAEIRDLLPTFESLLALTNLASTDDDSLREAVIRTTWQDLEDLLLARNELVQRAAVELVCNLVASPQGVMKFADGSPQANNRLHILLALADVEDLATRRAAGGALAMLTEWDKAAEAVLKKDRGVKILLQMCEDTDEMKHRGVVSLLNLVSVPDDQAVEKAVSIIKEEEGVEILKDMLRGTRDQQILSLGVELLKKILKPGSEKKLISG
ncbi:hypothetical protein AAFC00_001947 [Neodothiora populina]|uniref:UNC-45/Cro1/She4 central domain-containing protein n=1 Tax=Neodothiora populina TaxID=2781224 RepID=A0ABR3PQU8_9PEZI